MVILFIIKRLIIERFGDANKRKMAVIENGSIDLELIYAVICTG
jgi:hypothetical protein